MQPCDWVTFGLSLRLGLWAFGRLLCPDISQRLGKAHKAYSTAFFQLTTHKWQGIDNTQYQRYAVSQACPYHMPMRIMHPRQLAQARNFKLKFFGVSIFSLPNLPPTTLPDVLLVLPSLTWGFYMQPWPSQSLSRLSKTRVCSLQHGTEMYV